MENREAKHQTNLRLAFLKHRRQSISVSPKGAVRERKERGLVRGKAEG